MKNTILLTLATTLLLMLASCGEKITPPEPPKPDDGKYTGTLVVQAGTDTEFTMEDVAVKFTPDTTSGPLGSTPGTADVELLSVKFANGMPVMLDVLIPGITLTATAGGYTLSCGAEGIVPPALNGLEFPNQIFTEIRGTATATTLTLDMRSGGMPMTFTGTRTVE